MPRRVVPPIVAAPLPPPPPSPLVQRLRQDWRWAGISQFVWTFQEAFGLSDWDIEALERDMDGAEDTVVPELIAKLLYALTWNRQINKDNAFEQLHKQWLKRDPDSNLFGTLEEPNVWATLGLSQKVEVLWRLCEWQLAEPTRLRSLLKTEDDPASWRVDPVGWDKAGNTYFLFDDNRLWVQRARPAPPRPPKTTSSKSKRAQRSKPAPKEKRSHKKKTPVREISPLPEPVDEPVSGPRKRTQVKFYGNVTPTVEALKRGGVVQHQPSPRSERATRSSARNQPQPTLQQATPSKPSSRPPPLPRGTRVSRRLRNVEDEWQQIPDEWLTPDTKSAEGKATDDGDESDLSDLTDEEEHQAQLAAAQGSDNERDESPLSEAPEDPQEENLLMLEDRADDTDYKPDPEDENEDEESKGDEEEEEERGEEGKEGNEAASSKVEAEEEASPRPEEEGKVESPKPEEGSATSPKPREEGKEPSPQPEEDRTTSPKPIDDEPPIKKASPEPTQDEAKANAEEEPRAEADTAKADAPKSEADGEPKAEADGDTKMEAEGKVDGDAELQTDAEVTAKMDSDGDVKMATDGEHKAEGEVRTQPVAKEQQTATEDETDEVKLAIKEEANVPEGFIEWEAVCVTLYDWMNFPEQFAKSRDPDEKEFYKLLKNDIAPQIIEVLTVKEQERIKQEAINNRKRSSRIATRELAKEEEARREQAQREMEERMERARAEEAAKEKAEAELHAREAAREARLREREERIASREAAILAKAQAEQAEKERAERKRERRKRRREGEEVESSSEEEAGPSRKATRQHTPAKSVGSSVKDGSNGQSWELKCEVCKLHGWNLDSDDQDVVSCDECGRWQHTNCHDRQDIAAGRGIRDWDKVDFICLECKQRKSKRQRVDAPTVAPAQINGAPHTHGPQSARQPAPGPERRLSQPHYQLPYVNQPVPVGHYHPQQVPVAQHPSQAANGHVYQHQPVHPAQYAHQTSPQARYHPLPAQHGYPQHTPQAYPYARPEYVPEAGNPVHPPPGDYVHRRPSAEYPVYRDPREYPHPQPLPQHSEHARPPVGADYPPRPYPPQPRDYAPRHEYGYLPPQAANGQHSGRMPPHAHPSQAGYPHASPPHGPHGYAHTSPPPQQYAPRPSHSPQQGPVPAKYEMEQR